MSEGSTDPNFRLVDYLALGCILGATEEFIRDYRNWERWGAALLAGIVFLYFGHARKWAVRMILKLLPTSKAAVEANRRADEYKLEITKLTNELEQVKRKLDNCSFLLSTQKSYGESLKEQVSLLKQTMEQANTPQAVPTSLHLVFEGPNARSIQQSNIWRWFAFQHVVNQVDKDGTPTKTTMYWELFLVYERPVAFTQVIVPGSALLQFEVKDATARSSILVFHGDLTNKTILFQLETAN